MVDEPIALVVNAGGESRRMGRVKALLPMPPAQTPLIVHIIGRLSPLVTGSVVVVCNDAAVSSVAIELKNVVVYPDRWAGAGALGGVATGLGMCDGWAMVVACDMPLVSPAIFAKQVARGHPMLDAVIPRVAGQAQPFHGLWHRRTLAAIESRVAAGALGVQAALASMKVAWLDEAALGTTADDLAFYNVNTPQEWMELLAILAEQNRPVA
jgi:molybdopterin-guanine dinucleotide biosynthesis protein A